MKIIFNDPENDRFLKYYYPISEIKILDKKFIKNGRECWLVKVTRIKYDGTDNIHELYFFDTFSKEDYVNRCRLVI